MPLSMGKLMALTLDSLNVEYATQLLSIWKVNTLFHTILTFRKVFFTLKVKTGGYSKFIDSPCCEKGTFPDTNVLAITSRCIISLETITVPYVALNSSAVATP